MLVQAHTLASSAAHSDSSPERRAPISRLQGGGGKLPFLLFVEEHNSNCYEGEGAVTQTASQPLT